MVICLDIAKKQKISRQPPSIHICDMEESVPDLQVKAAVWSALYVCAGSALHRSGAKVLKQVPNLSR